MKATFLSTFITVFILCILTFGGINSWSEVKAACPQTSVQATEEEG